MSTRSLLLAFFLSLLFVGTVAASSGYKAQLPAYVAGQPTQFDFLVVGEQKAEVEFDVVIRYVGPWWGGGSGPATSTNAVRYWMECQSGQGCREWWRGTIPAGENATISNQLTTNPNWAGVYNNAVTVTGMVNGQPVDFGVPAHTLP